MARAARPTSIRPTPSSVDPRIARRRAEVARARLQLRRSRLVLVGAVLGAIGVAAGVTRTPLLDVDRFAVAGAERTTREAVVAATGVVAGSPMTDLIPTEVERRLEATLPWVATAEVSRSWPSTLRVTLVERSVVAQATDPSGRWFLVSADGVLVTEAQAADPFLVTIDGVVPDAVVGGRLVDRAAAGTAVLGAASDGVRTRIRTLRFTGEDSIELTLRPEGRVAFGAVEQADQKLRDLDTVLARVDLSCLAIIDLAVPAHPVLQRVDGCGS
ncbi:MAG: FtsQ-type POTRA domain-containing protein [Actinobacteria bacterium]|nr:FtsQ-type POTRA domain-containing protein [Actinomycetota bacterium]